MGLEGYFTLGVLIALIVCLAKEVAGSDFLFFCTLVVFMFAGTISPEEALSGFSNPIVAIIAALLIVGHAVQKTGALDDLINPYLKRNTQKDISKALLAITLPASIFSAFLNNTAVVVILLPIIKKWAKKIDQASSKFLIPLSYAAILGGLCTLIGTSTNLMMHGLMIDNGLPGLTMFELAKVGIPCAIVGWIYLAFLGHKFLPDRKDIGEVIDENPKEYVVAVSVKGDYKFIGKTIQQAELRNLEGLFLIGIERGHNLIGPVSHDEIIQENDYLIFAGVTSAVVGLYNKRGLVPTGEGVTEEEYSNIRAHLTEAVVSSSSPILGKSIKNCHFRTRYNAGVIAVHRNGQRVLSKIGDIKIKPGDTLLLWTHQDFINNWKNSEDFYLISSVKTIEPKSIIKSILALAILTAMVITITFSSYLPKVGGQMVGILHATFLAAIMLLATKCLTVHEAKKSIQWNVLITVACAIGISKAVLNSGAADFLADAIIQASKGFGVLGVLVALYIVTAIFTEFITNVATVALMFPIALSTAAHLNVNPKPLLIAITVAASASFLTPIGYQTNLIVQGAGGYKFTDYTKIGLPLSFLVFIISLLIIPVLWKL